MVAWPQKGFNWSTLTDPQRIVIGFIKVKEYEKQVFLDAPTTSNSTQSQYL